MRAAIGEGIVCETQEQARLASTRVTNQNLGIQSGQLPKGDSSDIWMIEWHDVWWMVCLIYALLSRIIRTFPEKFWELSTQGDPTSTQNLLLMRLVSPIPATRILKEQPAWIDDRSHVSSCMLRWGNRKLSCRSSKGLVLVSLDSLRCLWLPLDQHILRLNRRVSEMLRWRIFFSSCSSPTSCYDRCSGLWGRGPSDLLSPMQRNEGWFRSVGFETHRKRNTNAAKTC